MDRDISVDFDAFGVRIDAEVSGRLAQGKPRLRKQQPNIAPSCTCRNWSWRWLVSRNLPGRTSFTSEIPAGEQAIRHDQMDFDVVEDDGISVVLDPLRVSVLHSAFQVQLGDRLNAIAEDLKNIAQIG